MPTSALMKSAPVVRERLQLKRDEMVSLRPMPEKIHLFDAASCMAFR